VAKSIFYMVSILYMKRAYKYSIDIIFVTGRRGIYQIVYENHFLLQKKPLYSKHLGKVWNHFNPEDYGNLI